MDTRIRKKIVELKNDRLHSANWLSTKAVHIIGLTIKNSKATTVSQFIKEIEMTADAVSETRASMTSIASYVLQLVNKIRTNSQKQNQLSYAKSLAQSTVIDFANIIQQANVKAAQNGANIIDDQDMIITCSYSSTICTTFKIAKEQAAKFEVLIAESRYNDLNYGEIGAEQMRRYQIPVTVIADASINHYVKSATKALVGADTIRTDGSLVNGIPTGKLAQEAAKAKIPLYPICEIAKFETFSQQRKPFRLEPGFEIIPPELISGIITEAGIVKPDEVSQIWRQLICME
jgi:translation initiation factor 2B subunit (eIF-2B alpha/beta/delta family)